MPIIILLLLAVMIAQIGFWDTFTAVLGGVAMIALFLIIAVATVALAVYYATRRFTNRRVGRDNDPRLPRIG